MNVLKELVLDYGTDPWDWPAEGRREACIELYEGDENQKWATWLLDALSDTFSSANERKALLEALKHDSTAMRHAAIGIIVERALLNFPLDSLQRIAEEHLPIWTRRAS